MELNTLKKSMVEWELCFESEIKKMTVHEDPSHDQLHLKRVVKTAKYLAIQENANLDIVIPGAWLHDFVTIPKNSPLRKQASEISAVRAIDFLDQIDYPKQYHEAIAHCIRSHSFSANIHPETVEACIVQDCGDGLSRIRRPLHRVALAARCRSYAADFA